MNMFFVVASWTSCSNSIPNNNIFTWTQIRFFKLIFIVVSSFVVLIFKALFYTQSMIIIDIDHVIWALY